MAVHKGAYLKLVDSVIEIDGLFSYGTLAGSGLMEIELEEDIYFKRSNDGPNAFEVQAWAKRLNAVIVGKDPLTAMASEGTIFLVHVSQVEILRYRDDEEKT